MSSSRATAHMLLRRCIKGPGISRSFLAKEIPRAIPPPFMCMTSCVQRFSWPIGLQAYSLKFCFFIARFCIFTCFVNRVVPSRADKTLDAQGCVSFLKQAYVLDSLQAWVYYTACRANAVNDLALNSNTQVKSYSLKLNTRNAPWFPFR